jgi:hypothetical protein
MRKNLLVCALAVFAAALLSAPAALAAENWIGTWKLNAAKSKYSPGPMPKSLTLTYAATPEGVKFSSNGVDADGKPVQSDFVSKFDGKDVPYKGNPNADTASPKKVDDNTFENTWKKAGAATITARGVVSKDGKTLTITQKGKNAKGETVDATVVFEKQ